MVVLDKIVRTAVNASNPLISIKNIPDINSIRYLSSCCDDGKKSLPLIGRDNPNDPSVYDFRKYSHDLPKNNVMAPFEVVQNIPSGIFRNTEGEVLGLGAGKCCYYQCPEYFAYHHMSFYDISYHLKENRLPPWDTKRKSP